MSALPSQIKVQLRREIRAALAKLSPEECAAGSRSLLERLKEQVIWTNARSVLLFVPVGSEPDIRPLIGEALAQGKTVALPRHVDTGDFYEPRVIRDPASELHPGWLGVPEPGPMCTIFPANQLDFALVPGIGFSLDGGRLGRGKGYYDRLLAEVHGLKCGVAFDCQVLSGVPVEPHDVRLNCILTPTRWHLVSPAAVLK